MVWLCQNVALVVNVALSPRTHVVKVFPLENTKQNFLVYFSACGLRHEAAGRSLRRLLSILVRERVQSGWRKGQKSALNWTWPLLCQFIQGLEGGCRNLIVGKQRASLSLYLPYSILLRFRLLFAPAPSRSSFLCNSQVHVRLSYTFCTLFFYILPANFAPRCEIICQRTPTHHRLWEFLI